MRRRAENGQRISYSQVDVNSLPLCSKDNGGPCERGERNNSEHRPRSEGSNLDLTDQQFSLHQVLEQDAFVPPSSACSLDIPQTNCESLDRNIDIHSGTWIIIKSATVCGRFPGQI